VAVGPSRRAERVEDDGGVWRAPDPGDCPEVGGTRQGASERGIGEKSLRLRAGYVEPGSGDTYNRAPGSRFSIYLRAPFFTKISTGTGIYLIFSAKISPSETSGRPRPTPIASRAENTVATAPSRAAKTLRLSCRRAGGMRVLETQEFLFEVIPGNIGIPFPPPGLHQQSKVSSDAPEEMGIPSDA
jgi:hypothetical protein